MGLKGRMRWYLKSEVRRVGMFWSEEVGFGGVERLGTEVEWWEGG